MVSVIALIAPVRILIHTHKHRKRYNSKKGNFRNRRIIPFPPHPSLLMGKKRNHKKRKKQTEIELSKVSNIKSLVIEKKRGNKNGQTVFPVHSS